MKHHAMKLLVFFALCFVSFGAYAQVPKTKDTLTYQFPDTLYKFKGNNNGVLLKQLQKPLLGNIKGNIILLNQDHMPCVVPNTKEIVRMPNAWAEVTVPYKSPSHPIPNPALPKNQQNIPDNSLDGQVK